MKKLLAYISLFGIAFLLHSCTKAESVFTETLPETISVTSDATNVIAGTSITFTVKSSIKNEIVTGASKLNINGTVITGNTYTFPQAGTFAVFASKGSLNSNVISINVTANTSLAASFVSRVLVEDFSGTWCGNCPAILYGVDLLHKQTDKAIVVSGHLFNGDPFITSQGNSLAALLGITSVPSGKINRTTSWIGPQYENVPQVINQIKPTAPLGLAINSAVSGSTLNATVTVSYGQPLSGNAKLTVYIVEDKLLHTQANYSATLYSGQASIPNFEYNGVIRSIASNLSGDAIASNGTAVTKTYSMALPSNISNPANVRLVAFITNEAGTVINVQHAKLGTTKNLEIL
ncbi:Omp28-related outer membrane protein [Daejeonella sp.]|uniref:Omp28-related outer membrane protein n=1 Tax=Daejeonella sp. TaxID=2805397 RepID=UPI0030C5D3AD